MWLSLLYLVLQHHHRLRHHLRPQFSVQHQRLKVVHYSALRSLNLQFLLQRLLVPQLQSLALQLHHQCLALPRQRRCSAPRLLLRRRLSLGLPRRKIKLRYLEVQLQVMQVRLHPQLHQRPVPRVYLRVPQQIPPHRLCSVDQDHRLSSDLKRLATRHQFSGLLLRKRLCLVRRLLRRNPRYLVRQSLRLKRQCLEVCRQHKLQCSEVLLQRKRLCLVHNPLQLLRVAHCSVVLKLTYLHLLVYQLLVLLLRLAVAVYLEGE